MVASSTTETTDPQVNNVVEEGDGLEAELDDPQDKITHPFNPEKIKIRTVNIVVEQLVSRINHDEINLAPDFQRLRGIWNSERKSRLVESLLLRIPIPVFYVAADETENWSVVDGVQRMSTIYDYVTGQFPLGRLQYLTDLNGLKYDELPRYMQLRISETQLIINVIEPDTPQEVMFNVFLRINTGGMTLNGQEIRHALHPGPVRKYLEKLAKSDEFVKATDGSVKSDRMSDRECVLHFLAFHIEPWEKYAVNDLNGHLGDIMAKINKMIPTERDALAKDFKSAMNAAIQIFGNNAFRKPPGESGRRRPINRALFGAWSVQLARCSRRQITLLVERREDVQRRFIQLVKEDSDFDRAISSSTGTPGNVRKRFQTIKELVEEFI